MSQIHNDQFSPVSFAHHLNLSVNPFKSEQISGYQIYCFTIDNKCSTSIKRPQRRHLPNDARLRAIRMLEAGMRQVEVARRLGVPQSVISRLRTRLAQTNSTLDRRRSGRSRSTSQAQDLFLRTSALRSRSVSAEQLRECLSRTGTRVSVQAVRNRLHSAGLRAWRPYVEVPLSQRHRHARLAWTRQHRRWTNQQWATVLFTDESRFLLDMLDRRRHVWRRRGERYTNCAIVEHDRYKGGSLMVWGGISVRSRTELLVPNGTLKGQRYINEVLQPVVFPFVQQHHCRMTTQDLIGRG